jgi:NitT/TauT family transport system ATP-binding protein
MTVAVTLEQVSRRFDDGTLALEAINLAIPQGRTTVILGASGCGKTTLLRMICGLDVPTSGTVRWPGPPPPIGYVFQSPALMPWATVEANVALPLAVAGRDDPARVGEVLDQVGLGMRAKARPFELSGGMQMRVSMARALAARPKLLLLDEPFAALDEVTRHDLQLLLTSLAAHDGLSVVLVTHSVSEAVFLADQLVLMTPHPGRIATSDAVIRPEPLDQGWRHSADYGARAADLSQRLRATMPERKAA